MGAKRLKVDPGVVLDSSPGSTRVTAASAQDVVGAFLRNDQNAEARVEGHLVHR